MRYTNMQLFSSQRPGNRRIRIAIHQHPFRLFLYQHFLYLLQHLSGHRPMSQSVYIQIIMRPGYTHLLKKHITHIRIKMLPRMYNNFFHPFSSRQNPADHRSLHKLRTRPDNRYYLHCLTRLIINSQK